MNSSQAQLNSHATAMFTQMQRILEDRETPVVGNYAQDFYKRDRKDVERTFVLGGEYLWLLHPHGTEFGMIGTVPVADTHMFSVISLHEMSHSVSRMEMYHIKVAEDGTSTFRRVGMEAGKLLIKKAAQRFKSLGDSFYDGATHVAVISVKLSQNNHSNRSYISKVETDGGPITSLQAAAATMHAELMADKLTDSFARCEERYVNGELYETAIPPAQIPPVEPGTFAPAPRDRNRW